MHFYRAKTEQIAELEAARDEATAKIESLESTCTLAASNEESAARIVVSLNSIRQNCKLPRHASVRRRY